MNDTREFLQFAREMPRESQAALVRIMTFYESAVEQAKMGRWGLAILVTVAWLIPSPIYWIDDAWAIVLSWLAE